MSGEMKWIDLRSDTVTQPTPAMREAMANAAVGDDVYEDDPTVRELEQLAAEKAGKEAALFVPSGTFGNQLCIMTHCLRGDEILVGDPSHILVDEVGALGVIAGVQSRTFDMRDGRPDLDEILYKMRTDDDIHSPRTGLLCLEDALADGRILRQDDLKAAYELAHAYGIPVHIDGARLFNAAVAQGIDVKEITQYCDSVMFCVSKGLCAPVGSLVAGSADFNIAPGADGKPGLYGKSNLDGAALKESLYRRGIKINTEEVDGSFRFVTHEGITPEDIDYMTGVLKEVLAS